MFPFDPLENMRKPNQNMRKPNQNMRKPNQTKGFSCFQGNQKGALGRYGLKI